MVPRNFATKKQLDKRLIAFENTRMTTHYLHKAKLFPKIPQTYGKPLMNIKNITLEDIKTYITEDGLKLI
jgi:poly-beta-hydroxyalkanoate depolymerase